MESHLGLALVDRVVLGVLVMLLALVFYGLVAALRTRSRNVGGRLSRRAASSLVVRRILRADRRDNWN